MEDEPVRSTSRSFEDAVEVAAASRPSTPVSRPPVPPHRHPVVGVVALVLVMVGAWMTFQGVSDPIQPDPDDITMSHAGVVAMVRGGVERYYAEHGSLPADLETIGMADVGVEYVADTDVYDLTTEDAWGATIGYHGVPGGTP